MLLHEGSSGERAVARVRLVVVAILLILPHLELLLAPESPVARSGIWTAAAALIYAVVAYLFVRFRPYHPWFGFVTSVLDVSFVSAALVVPILAGRPDIAMNSRLMYSVYFLAIGAMALRYDARVCVLVGLLALMQYALIVAYAGLRWSPDPTLFRTPEYDSFSLGTHYARVAILFCGVLLSTSIALRKQRLRWLAARDPLTKLLNRGFFDERMQAEVARTHRTGRLLSVALIDIDKFKEFNDNFGHIVGDEVLRVLARILQKSVRKSDLVARYGGEEFIVLFQETPAEYAEQTAERLRVAIEQTTVTVSIGVAELPTDGKDGRTVVDRADQRLYEAKSTGRNKVVGPQNADVIGR